MLAPMSRGFRLLVRRVDPLTVAAGLAAALPVIVSTIRAVSDGWLPTGDDAQIVVRALDVLSTHSPLVGQYSASSSVIGEAVASPGPMVYWLLALPARLGHLAPAIAMGAVNAACVVGTVALARRRGGVALMLVVAGAIALMCRSLEAQIYHDVWNPSAAVLPFALLVFLAWSVAAGEHALLAPMAVVGSFVAQAQLAYALPVSVLLGVALGFLVGSHVAVPRRTVALATAALLLCWSLPLADEVVHRPGNLEQIARVATSGVRTFGWAAGWHSVEHAVGVVPWWLRSQRDGIERLADVGFAPGALTAAGALAVLAGLIALLVVAARRRERELAAGLALALGLCVALATVTARSPTEHNLFTTIDYTLWWASVAGMFAWVVLGWAAASLLRPLRRIDALRPGVAVAGVAVVAAIGTVVGAVERPDPRHRNYAPIARLVERVRAAVAPGPTLQLVGPKGLGAAPEADVTAAVAYELRRHGVDFVTADVVGIGHRYDPGDHPYVRFIRVDSGGPDAPARGGRVIARAELPDASPPGNRVVVTLGP
jgi:hypothetical protein